MALQGLQSLMDLQALQGLRQLKGLQAPPAHSITFDAGPRRSG